jgi:hypothetical protein
MAATFGTTDVAKAARIAPRVLAGWIIRGIVAFNGGDLRGRGHGDRHRFSLRTAIRIRLVADLIKLGIMPARASFWSKAFNEQTGEKLILAGTTNGAAIFAASGMTAIEDIYLEASRHMATQVRGYEPGHPFTTVDITTAIREVKEIADLIESNLQ